MSGVRSIEDIKDRCRIDGDCWIWARACARDRETPVTYVPSLGRVVTVSRAVLHFQGVELTPSVRTWRTCFVQGCCAPKHVGRGSSADYGAAVHASGRWKGTVKGSIAAKKPRKSHIPAEIRREMVSSPGSCKEVAERLGVSPTSVSRHRRNQVQPLACNASVFAWAAARSIPVRRQREAA